MKEWLITIIGDEISGPVFYRAKGTEEKIKELLVRLVKDDRANDSEHWRHGTESVEDIEMLDDEFFYAYASYGLYTLDYVAKPLDSIRDIEL